MLTRDNCYHPMCARARTHTHTQNYCKHSVIQQNSFNLALLKVRHLRDSGPKTDSSAIHNFWCAYWLCDSILGFLDLIASIQPLQSLQKIKQMSIKGIAGKRKHIMLMTPQKLGHNQQASKCWKPTRSHGWLHTAMDYHLSKIRRNGRTNDHLWHQVKVWRAFPSDRCWNSLN
jgi:hypothetical protein